VTHKLTIEFQGICAHFRGLVPGVPHRVVVPDASATRLGLVDVQGMTAPILYALMPHVAGIVVAKPDTEIELGPEWRLKEQSKFNIPDLMVLGAVIGGLRVQIANASQTALEYDKGYDEVPSIREFVPYRNFSTDVVLSGRASLYFDFFAGTVRAEAVGHPRDPARRTVVTVDTDGPPVLLITPFFTAEELSVSDPRRAESYRVTLDTETHKLIVGNFDLPHAAAPGFDYLWHFTVMQGGIPRKLANFPPGMEGAVIDEMVLADVLARHAAVLKRIKQTSPWWPIVTLVGTEPSCSDSRFP
jgi:hypothetical protein